MLLDHIVVGVDFNAASVAAARWTAQSLAPEAEITLVHCIPPTKQPTIDTRRAIARARQKLEELRDELGADRVRVEVCEGIASDRIAELAARVDADLVVVGPHNRHPQTADSVGSTAERLVNRSCAPVLLATGELRGPPRRLLLPVQGPVISAFVFEWARALEARCGARVSVLHVDVARCYSGAESGLSGTPRWRRLADGFDSNVFVDAVTTREPATAVMSQADRFSSDLVVLGDGTFGASSPPVIRRLFEEAHRPVLVIPEPAR